jgi:hypothetical protein
VTTPVRAVYRGYWTGGKRAGQVRRLHVIREDGPRGWPPGTQTLCGQGTWGVQHSDAVILDPLPDRPPEGLAWCPKCVGHLAEKLGLLTEVGSSLAAYGLSLTGELAAKHAAEEDHYRAIRREQLQGGR